MPKFTKEDVLAHANPVKVRTVSMDEPMATSESTADNVQESLERLAQRINICIVVNADVLQQPYPDDVIVRKEDAAMGALARCNQLHCMVDLLQDQIMVIRNRVGQL
jgi:hypothetical protein